MKSMKLIMENFRKTMNEAWPGTPEPQAPWGKDPKPYVDMRGPQQTEPEIETSVEDKAKAAAVKDIMRQYTELELHNMMYDEMEDLFVNRFSDNHPEEALPRAEDVADMMLTVGVLNPEEKYDEELPSDQEEPPGFMPGEGGNY